MNKRLYISPPSVTQKEIDYVTAALKSNWIATTGEYIDLFERRLEEYLDNKAYVVALNSGTSAIHLALVLLGIKKGDEVLVQSNTHIGSVNPILYLGATPVFVDSERDTWNISPVFLEEAIKARLSVGVKPKAIVVVDLYGTPYQVEAIQKISNKYGIPVLEDAAEAVGSKYKEEKCGLHGDIGVFSFNGNKLLSTMAGGALIVRTKELKEKAIYFSNQAKLDYPYFEHSEIGFNYRMTNISASYGVAQLERLTDLLELRKNNYIFYKQLMDQYQGLDVFSCGSELSSNNWLTFVLINTKNVGVDELRLAFEKESIETRRMWKPMHLQPLFRDNLYFGEKNSEGLFDTGLCLPSGSILTSENKISIKKVFDSFFDIKV